MTFLSLSVLLMKLCNTWCVTARWNKVQGRLLSSLKYIEISLWGGLHKWTKEHATSTTPMHSKCMMPWYAMYREITEKVPFHLKIIEVALLFDMKFQTFYINPPLPRLYPLQTSLATSHERVSLLTSPPWTPVTLRMPLTSLNTETYWDRDFVGLLAKDSPPRDFCSNQAWHM